MTKIWPKLNQETTNDNVFSTKNYEKLVSWKQEKNEITILLSLLASDKYQDTTEEKNKLIRIIHWHFALKGFKNGTADTHTEEEMAINNQKYEALKVKDWLNVSASKIRGDMIDTCRKITNDPQSYLNNSVTKDEFKKLITKLISEEIKRNTTIRTNESTAGKKKETSFLY